VTNLNRNVSVQVGLHTTTSDFSTMPTVAAVLPRANVPSLLPRKRAGLARPLRSPGGIRFAKVRGEKAIDGITLPLDFRGVNANTGAAVAAWEAKMEQGALLASLFGAVAAATTGAATTASGTAAATLTVAAGTDIPNGSVILFTTTTGTFIRRVTAGGGTTTLTLNQAASGTASGTVIRLGRYTGLPSVNHHQHVAVDWEQLSEGVGVARRQYVGCAPSKGVITIPNNGLLTFDVDLMPTDWTRQAPASPTFVQPTAGEAIATNNVEFRIGANLFDVRDLKITIDNQVAMRETVVGVNGVRGGVCGAAGEEGKIFMLEGSIIVGGTVPGQELQDNTGSPTIRELLGDVDAEGAVVTARDIMLAVGGSAGSCMGLFMPTADMDCTYEESGPFQFLKFVAYGTGATPAVLAVG
jgi:hypothetical protein